MAVFGVDLGNLFSTVSVARRRGIDIIINEVSKRETSSFVSFGNAQEGRMIGEKGHDMKIRNIRNTVTNLKRLVGVKLDSPAWEAEKKFCTFQTQASEDGYVCALVNFDGEEKLYRPEQLIAMLLTKLRSYAEREALEDSKSKGVAHVTVVDCVVSCPPYYSALERKLLLQATEIAGLNCLSITTEGTSVALNYGIFKSESLPEKEEDGIIVMFCDVGHSCSTITTAKYWKGNLKILSSVYDKSLGCRDFDYALADYFRGEIETKYKMDVYEQKKSKLRLLDGVSKLRYTLSANPTVSLNIECIMNDVDISFPVYTRDEFDQLVEPLWQKMDNLVKRALEETQQYGKPSFLELVGGGSYMPRVKKALEAAFNQPISTTLNASEAVAKGCGIIGAVLSPRFQVKSFKTVDTLVYPFTIGYKSATSTDASPCSFIPEINSESSLGSHFPSVFDMKFERKSDFDLYAYYKEDCSEVVKSGANLLLVQWRIHGLPPARDLQGNIEEDKGVKVVVRFRQDARGLISVESAHVDEAYEVEEEVEKRVEKKEGDKAEKTDEKKKDGDKVETEKVLVKKKKVRKIDVLVDIKHNHGLTSTQVTELAAIETKLRNADQLLVDTLEAKNTLESYCYDNKSRVQEGGIWFDYLLASERDAFATACTETADWLYDAGFESTKEEYVKRLTELRKPGDKAAKRLDIREGRPLFYASEEKKVLATLDEANRLLGTDTHIPKEQLQEIVAKGTSTLESIKEEKIALDAIPKNQDVPASNISTLVTELNTFARPIFNTPKPKPPTPPPAEEKPATAEEEEKPAEPPVTQADLD